jgi:hypothetical protein
MLPEAKVGKILLTAQSYLLIPVWQIHSLPSKLVPGVVQELNLAVLHEAVAAARWNVFVAQERRRNVGRSIDPFHVQRGT